MPTLTPAVTQSGTLVYSVNEQYPLFCSNSLACSNILRCSDNGLTAASTHTGTLTPA
jgi:hypothetical protein